MSDFLRGEDDEVASFFAFQDVITAVLGILILIALQLSFTINVVSADGGNESSPSGAEVISEEELIEAREKREELESRLQQLKQEVTSFSERKRKLSMTAQSSKDLEVSLELLELEVEQLQQEYDKMIELVAKRERDLASSAERLGLTDSLEMVKSMSEDNEKLEKEVNEMEQRLKEMKNSLNEASEELSSEAGKKSVWLIPQRDDNTKDPLLVKVDGKHMTFEEFDKPESLRVLDTSSLTKSFEFGVRDYDPSVYRIVFLFKPSGAHTFDKITDLATDRGFDIGYDPIEESQEIIFSLPD